VIYAILRMRVRRGTLLAEWSDVIRMTIRRDAHLTRIALHGDLRSADVPLLAHETRGRRREVEIDLAGVTFADADASRFLADLERAGVALRHPSPFLRTMLREIQRDATAALFSQTGENHAPPTAC